MRLFPRAYCESAYDIDYEGLYEEGCRGVIFDIDNTLVEDQQEATKNAVDLIDKIRSTVFVGDQIYTDIWGANNAGVFSILVAPVNPRELFHIRLKRLLELPVLMLYRLLK